MRGAKRLLVLAGAVLLAAGCDETGGGEAARAGWPLGAAGAACQLLDYDDVEAALGTTFDTAGGASVETTYTCVLTRGEQEYPDLTLALTPSSADEVIFTAMVIPSGATQVPELGRIAYSLQRPAGDGHGPGIEVGWLSATGRLMMLRYTFAADADAEAVQAMTARVLAFAQQIDQALPPTAAGV